MLKILFYFFVSTKGQNRDKSDFVKNVVGIIVTIIFMQKSLSRIPCKIFATQCFFTDHLKHKTANKTICRMPSANPRHLCAHYLLAFQLL